MRAPPGSPVPLSPGLQYNSVSTSLKRRRSSKAVMHEPPRSKRESKGWKLVLEGDGPLSMDQGSFLLLVVRGPWIVAPLSLASIDEEGAYTKIVVASSKVDFVELYVFLLGVLRH